MSLKKLRLGVVGLGKMGQRHLQKALSNSEVEISGIYDLDLDKSFEIGSEHKLKVFREFEELLFDTDALIISTSTKAHFPLAIKALEHRVPLFIEKPICESVEQAERLILLAKEKNIPIQTGFVERFCWRRLREHEPNLFTERPQMISTERCSSSPSREKGLDIVSDLMIHDIDFVLWSLGEPPTRIDAEGVSLGASPIDIAFARIEFASGAVAHLKTAWALTEPKRNSQIYVGGNLVSFDLLNRRAQYLTADSKSAEACFKELDPLTEQLNSFIKSVTSGSPCVVDGWDGLKAIEVSELIKHQILHRGSPATILTEREHKFLLKAWSVDVS